MEIKTVAILGAGIMGHGIAQVAGIAGYKVHLRDVNEELLQNGMNNLEKSLGRMVKGGKIAKEDVKKIVSNIQTTTSMEKAVQDADLVIEAIPEDFTLNGAILAQNGRIIRHHYNYFKCSHSSDKMKNQLNFYGSLISNFASYWNFTVSPQSPACGFIKSTLDYDSFLLNEPPPYFPNTIEYRFISWEEVRG